MICHYQKHSLLTDFYVVLIFFVFTEKKIKYVYLIVQNVIFAAAVEFAVAVMIYVNADAYAQNVL
jgi:hypothetical protein